MTEPETTRPDPGSASPARGAAGPSSQSFWAIARRQFLRNRLAVGGLVIVLLLATVAVWCPLLATDQPYYIRTVFQEEYENAYYSSLDLLRRLERFERDGPAAGESVADARQNGRLLADRLRDLESSLAGEAQETVEGVRQEARKRIDGLGRSGGGAGAGAGTGAVKEHGQIGRSDVRDSSGELSHEGTGERIHNQTGDLSREEHKDQNERAAEARDERAAGTAWEQWRAVLESRAAPGVVTLAPKTLYPAVRSLGAIEVFFFVFWAAAVVVWVSGTWRRGARRILAILFVPAAVVAVAWRIANPPVIDTTDYRQLIEHPEAPATYFRAPVAYGENENLTREANQAPTWILAVDKRVEGQHLHVLGTDPSGRDVLARMIYGTRISMLIGIVAVSIFVTIGIVVGAVAGYFGGWVDIGVSRIIEIVICFPTLFLLLILLAYIRPNIYTIMAALGLISWTGVARLERGEFLRLVNQDFVQAVRALGGGSLRIIFRHVLPNALGPVLVSASFGIAGSILAESTLSFLGFGVPPDQASWGGLLKIGNENIQELWWLVLFPGVALFTTVTCFNLVGEGVRDATDPRLIQ